MRSRFRTKSKNRDGHSYLALPHVVLSSPDYLELNYGARALLIDIAAQYTGSNNGKLVACMKYLGPRGWTSNDTISRGIKALLKSNLLVRTREGARPNKAAWYALGWLNLDVKDGLDIDHNDYRRGRYRLAPLKPTIGVGGRAIAPIVGERLAPVAPVSGAVRVA